MAIISGRTTCRCREWLRSATSPPAPWLGLGDVAARSRERVRMAWSLDHAPDERQGHTVSVVLGCGRIDPGQLSHDHGPERR
jgi:hypothetical protein